MRLLALDYGFSLSDAGIKFIGTKNKTERILDPKIAASMKALSKTDKPVTEKEIMIAFGMKYIKPEDRDI